jgi:hypothetical protein
MKRFLEFGGVAAAIILVAFGAAAIVLGVNGKHTRGEPGREHELALNSSFMADQLGNFGIVVGIALLLSGIGFLLVALGGIKTESWLAVWFAQRRNAKTGKPTPAVSA